MNNVTKPNKRIVSKGEYVRAQGVRVGLWLYGSWGVFLSILTGISAMGCVYIMAMTIIFAVNDHKWRDPTTTVSAFGFAIGLGIISVYTWRVGFARIREASTNEVILLNRANTADLPAPDSLVRASHEPAQSQESVLLRASGEAQDIREEQLLRASAGD